MDCFVHSEASVDALGRELETASISKNTRGSILFNMMYSLPYFEPISLECRKPVADKRVHGQVKSVAKAGRANGR